MKAVSLIVVLNCALGIWAGYAQSSTAPGQPLTLICITPIQETRPKIDPKIYQDPDADFKQRRGQIHNRAYLQKKLAPLHLNVDSLQDVVDRLNRNTKDKEWEYQISTMENSEGKILKFYKSHRNADGSSGRTIYGEEKRRQPDREIK